MYVDLIGESLSKQNLAMKKVIQSHLQVYLGEFYTPSLTTGRKKNTEKKFVKMKKILIISTTLS